MYSGIETYFESGVLSADPIELIRMLYRGAVDAVEKARQHLREGDIAARSAQITKAGAIIAHLTFSVNRDVDPALGSNLVELYDYMQRRLLRANLDQADPPLAEVSQLLSTLLEGWVNCEAGDALPAATMRAPEHSDPAPAEDFPWNRPAETDAAWPPPGSYGTYGVATETSSAPAAAYAAPPQAYAETMPRAYNSPAEAYAPAGAYAETVPDREFAETVGAGVYSQTSGAGAYSRLGGSGAYAESAGLDAEAEPEVEYASHNWSF
jgi:flagellar protein FliS